MRSPWTALKSMDSNYWAYRSRNVCPRCGVRSAAPGRARCEICLAKNAEASAQYRKTHTDAGKADRERARKARRKADGVCVRCGKGKPWDGTQMCMECAVKERKYQREYPRVYQRKETPEQRLDRLRRQAAMMTEKAREKNRKRMDEFWRGMAP